MTDLERGRRLRDGLVVALTVATGVTDVIGFVTLGGVFTSVYTANMVFLGLSIAQGNGALAASVGIAAAAYISGVTAGGRIARLRKPADALWPRRVTRTLAVELVALVALAALWEVVGGHPGGASHVALLALAALAMGLQGAAVNGLGVTGLSSTYMTGTLTLLLHRIVVDRHVEWRSLALIVALVGGAALGGVLLFGLRWATPLASVAVLAVVLALSRRPVLQEAGEP